MTVQRLAVGVGAALLVALIVAPSSVECAWVLWAAADDPAGNRKWHAVSGFPSDTIYGLDKSTSTQVDMGWKNCIKERDDMQTMLRADNRNPYATCLPVGVDPSEPKTK